MKQLFPRGKRIRPTDKDLVFHTALAALFPVFLLVVLLFHTGQIAGTNWQEVSLSQIAQDINIPYGFLKSVLAYLVRPKLTYAGKPVKLEKEYPAQPITAVRSDIYGISD